MALVNASTSRFAQRNADVLVAVAIGPLNWVWRERGDVIDAWPEGEVARRREHEILSGTYDYAV
jgi:hypothetical protein